ncbi:MAG: A/G-specific adenine glycosylase [Acaryochloridaceae cyanobacterium RU_4_10]|nr:A/G-specific adenine glycosylase [Acaryochloridaceae cyanobacterium RU_4_10]
MQANKVKWFQKHLSVWAASNLRDFPWRQTTDPYSIFVAEFLLQKTLAATTSPIYKAFLEKYPSLEDLATASVEEVTQLLQPLGLSFRAERLCHSAKIVAKKYKGSIPALEEELLSLPGIGKYTARSICANAFGQPSAVLDTNVARIFERFFGLQGERVKSRCKILWAAADAIAPQKEVSRWNLTLLDFGALVCIARKPHCNECPLQKKCCYFAKTKPL